MDVINRLRPVITEIERIEENVLIITHRVVARVLLGYFLNLSRDIIANLDVPLHCVYCLEPRPYGVTWSLYEYDEEKDHFFKVPQSEMNTMKVKEVGLVHAERRYSIIPTAPHVPTSTKGDFLANNASSSSLAKLAPSAFTVGGGTSISRPTARSQLAQPRSSILSRQAPGKSLPEEKSRSNSSPPHTSSSSYQIQIDKLNEKLAKLKTSTLKDDTVANSQMSRSRSQT